jgi:hypothetical protein
MRSLIDKPRMMRSKANKNAKGLLTILIGDGRPLIAVTGLALVFSGVFALFLGLTHQLLPHDVAFLEMTAADLHGIADGRVVHFMMHDRVAFGGALIAIGTLYLWLAAVPLAYGERWSWWTLLASGALGFGSFLLYLGYGYLDTWHGVATLVLAPLYITGITRTFRRAHATEDVAARMSQWPRSRRNVVGRVVLLLTASCIALGGAVICAVGVTSVFVPQDLTYMRLTAADLSGIDARLIPLIAHDRAGFGGGVATTGVTMFLCVWFGEFSRSLWETLLVVCLAGFGTAIGVHPYIGYNDFIHLAPAYLGITMFLIGLAITYGGWANDDPRSGNAEH